MENTKQPIETFRCNALKAAIWENKTDDDVKYAVTFSLRNRKDNQWKTTATFGEDDLISLIVTAQMAHHAIMFHNLADGKLKLIR